MVYNPFEKFAGWKAFGIGLIILLIATIIGYFGNTVFFGISVKTVPEVTWNKAFLLQGLGLAVIVLVMWLIALLSAKHVRFQDILGTVTLAKYPLIFASVLFWVFGKPFIELSMKMIESLNDLSISLNPKDSIQESMNIFSGFTISDYLILGFLSIVSLSLIVWTIALLYNAFRVSTNLKGAKCVVLFITILIISEIITNVIISIIY